MCAFTQLLSHVQLFSIPWTVVHQAPLSIGFPSREYWSRLPFPSGISCVSWIGRQILYCWANWEAPTIYWVDYKQQKFISHSSGVWEVQDQGANRFVVWWEPSSYSQMADFLLCPPWQTGRGCPLGSCRRALIPLIGAPPSWPNHLSEAPPPNFLTLGIRFGHMYKFGETQIFCSRVAILF